MVAIDGRAIDSFADMQRIVGASAGRPLEVTIDRGGVRMDLRATPALKEIKDSFGNMHRIGVLGISRSMAPGDVRMERVPPLTAVAMGFEETWFVIERTMSYLGGVVAGRESADQLGGPIRIAQVSGQVASIGIAPFCQIGCHSTMFSRPSRTVSSRNVQSSIP